MKVDGMFINNFLRLCIFVSIVFCISCTNPKDTVAPTETTSPSTNQAPATPTQPNPVDGAYNITAPKTFSWSCYDPDLGDTLSYQIIMGVGSYTDTFHLYRGTSFIVNQLSASSDYIWRVDATDNHGSTTIGSIWHFRTY
jgi:hypothetical protein